MEEHHGKGSSVTRAESAEMSLKAERFRDHNHYISEKGLPISPKKHSHGKFMKDVTPLQNFRSLKVSQCWSSESLSSVHSDRSESTGVTDVDSTYTKDSTFDDLDAVETLKKVTGQEVHDLSDNGHTLASFVHSRIESGAEKASFLVTNLATVITQYQQWHDELPMVHPFYAVKCNPDPVIVKVLALLGCGFDCATMGEIDLVLNRLGNELSFGPRGIAHSSIVYANPAKMEHMLDFAIQNNVRMTVFDGEDELHKIAGLANCSSLQLLLRLATEDKASVCQFSKKFGAPVAEAAHLLKVSRDLGLNVAGVSFHVGSGCGDAEAYATALEHTCHVFEEAERLGMPALHIVDLGGGFPGDSGGYGGPGMPTFQQLAARIRTSIDKLCAVLDRPMDSFRFIAEPGRYFVSASTAITSKIYSRKGGKEGYQALYIDDGVYGSFNNVVYDHCMPVPRKLLEAVEGEKHEAELIPTAVFGPTCDGLDQLCTLESTLLHRCAVGDWLMFENQGAYTHTASFVFNGYTHIPRKTYCYV